MEKTGKVWGHTIPVFFKNNVEINNIFAKKGGFCSKHKHEHKYNLFFVISGKLKISVWKNDYDLVDETILYNDQCTSVAPGEFHQFEALEDTIGLEIYWTELDKNDIERETHGGTT